MKPLPSGLSWCLRDIVGSRFRFWLLVLMHIGGFTLATMHLDLSFRQAMDLALWGLAAPVLYLALLRSVLVSVGRVDDRDRAA